MCLRGRVASFGKRRTVEFSTLRAHGLSSGNSLGFQADRKMNRGASVIRVGGKGDAFGDARVRNDADEHPFDGDSRVVRMRTVKVDMVSCAKQGRRRKEDR